jgi:hypothetical protein
MDLKVMNEKKEKDMCTRKRIVFVCYYHFLFSAFRWNRAYPTRWLDGCSYVFFIIIIPRNTRLHQCLCICHLFLSLRKEGRYLIQNYLTFTLFRSLNFSVCGRVFILCGHDGNIWKCAHYKPASWSTSMKEKILCTT